MRTNAAVDEVMAGSGFRPTSDEAGSRYQYETKGLMVQVGAPEGIDTFRVPMSLDEKVCAFVDRYATDEWENIDFACIADFLAWWRENDMKTTSR